MMEPARLEIRPARDEDFEGLWPIFHEIVEAGETWPFAPGISREEAFDLWMRRSGRIYAALSQGRVVATYNLLPNKPGLGSHVANAGFMVSADCRGRGLGRALGEHALAEARRLGFKAMQFNLVVETNQASKNLWLSLGFKVVGRLEKAFAHKKLGYVDALVMYKWWG